MKLFLNFSEYAKTGGGTWEDFSLGLLNEGFSRKSCFGPKGKAEMQTVSMRLKPVVGLEALAVRILTATNNIRARLTLDDDTPYFIGTIRPLISSDVREVIKPISVEILDDSYYLEAYIFSADATLSSNLKVISDTPSDSLIHWLVSHATVKDSLGAYVPAFAEADIVIDSGIDKTIDADGLTVETGDYVNAILDTVCYEYNLQYRCSEDGKLHFAPSVPATTPSGVRTITNADIKNYVTPKRGDDARKGAVITYYPVVKGPCTIGRHDAMDSRYADDKTWGRGYEWLNPDEGQWPPLAYQNVTLATNDLEKSKRKILRYDYGTLRTKIKFHDGSKDTNQGIGHISDNEDGSARMYIQVAKRKTLVERMDAICDCWYIDEEDEQTTQVHQGQNPEKYEARYLHSGVTANALLRAIVLRSTTGNLTHSFQALPSLGLYPGEIIKLDPAALGFSGYVRIISVIDSGGDKTRQLVDVIAESVTPLNDIEVDTDEQVISILRRAGVNMLSIQTEATLLKYDDLSYIDLTANGDLLSVYGGSVLWYLNDVYKGTGETISLYHSEMLVGVNTIRAEGTIPGINFQDKPLEAEIAVTLVSDGVAGTRMVIQYALGTLDAPYPSGGTLVGTDSAIVGTSGALLGVDNGNVWSSIAPTPGEGEFVWRREGTYTPPEVWPNVWEVTRVTGANGADARVITLTASQSVINVSSRGELKTQEIEITCVPSNLPIESAVWTATDAGSLSQIEIAEGVYDPYKRLLNCSLVSGDSTLITVSITYGGETYTGVVGITKVADGTPTPMYLDARNEVPELTPEGPLVVGDFFLYVGPYSGPNSDPGDQGLNPSVAEVNEFIYGRIYEYLGKNAEDEDQWQESRKSEHFSAAQKDALEIAKNSGKYVYVAVVVAQLGLFMDLIIAGILKSTNYTESSSGVPMAGFKLDGLNGLIKALGLEAYSAMIYGNLEASGFRTLQEEGGTTIGVSTISPTLWKHSEMEDLVASQDTLATLSGTIEGFSFTKATRRSNQRVLLASHGYEFEEISAGEHHKFTKLRPTRLFGVTYLCEGAGYYSGYSSRRQYFIVPSPEDGTAQYLGYFSENYTFSQTHTVSDEKFVDFYITHISDAWWGSQSSYVNYHRIWTNQVFSGLVLVNGETSFKVIEPEPNAYYPNSKTWTIGSYNQNSIDNYCSGTDFYNKFSSLAVGADGFCDGGQIRVNGTLYTVTRLTKNANSITFYTSGGVVTVNKFQEGTSVGVYTSLAVTQAINFQAVAGGIETKHIFPWGTQAGTPGSYDIGTSSERFNTAWLNYLDIKGKPPLLTKSLNGYPGMVHADGTDSNWLRTPLNGLIPYASGGASALGSSAWPFNNGYFKNLNVTGPIVCTTIDTGYGANEVYKITNELLNGDRTTVSISAMSITEIRFVCAYLRSDSDGSPRGYVKLPAGGTYIVVNSSSVDISSRLNGSTYTPSSPVYYPGGYIIASADDGDQALAMFIIRRIS
jgi:hypothetical protein